MRRCVLGLLSIGSLTACGEGFTGLGGPGFLALTMQLDPSVTAAPTSYRVHIEGPTSRTLTLSPGTTESATGLQPGTYTVAVEGLVGTDIELYGEQGGVTVASEQETQVTANFPRSFRPSLQDAGMRIVAAPGASVPISWAPVTHAAGYRVELDDHPLFANAQVQTTTSTTFNVTAALTGSRYVRVRALSRFGATSLPSGSINIDSGSSSCTPSTADAVHLLGDKDGFGRGMNPGDELTPQIFDDRSTGDPFFTDVNPAYLDNFPAPDPKSIEFSYNHTFSVPGGTTIVSATLRLLTLGVQDGDNQVQGSDTDIELFFDGVEVPGAFDDVDQFRFNGSAFVGVVGEVTLTLPAAVLSQLADGSATLRINTVQRGTSSGVSSWAADYSELSVCVQ